MHLFAALNKHLQRISLRDGSHSAEVGRTDPRGGGAGVGQSGVDTRPGLLPQHVVTGRVAPRVDIGALSFLSVGRPGHLSFSGIENSQFSSKVYTRIEVFISLQLLHLRYSGSMITYAIRHQTLNSATNVSIRDVGC